MKRPKPAKTWPGLVGVLVRTRPAGMSPLPKHLAPTEPEQLDLPTKPEPKVKR